MRRLPLKLFLLSFILPLLLTFIVEAQTGGGIGIYNTVVSYEALYNYGFLRHQYNGTNDAYQFNHTGAGGLLFDFQVLGASIFYCDRSANATFDGDFTITGTTDVQDLTVGSDIEWSSGNVTYIPLAGDIQTYVTAATAGDTLVLASGVYTITSTITIDKELNIVGQGRSGFITTPVTPSHGTLIGSSTAAVLGFSITNDNVRVANLSISLTGAGSTAIQVGNNLEGIVFNDMDIIVDSTGANMGISIKGSDAVVRDVTYYVTSSDSTAAGLYFWNDSTTTRNAVVDCWNVTGTAGGASGYAYSLACYNVNDANTLTLNLSNSVARVLSGTANDLAVISTSVTTNNSTVNCYMCTLDGADFDAAQSGSNVLSLGGSVLENNTVSGTVTYRATMTSDAIVTGQLTYIPTAAQVIDAVGDAILANGTLTVIDPDGDYTLTSTPTIADGTTGQQLAITAGNAEANTVWIQDQDILGSSNIQLLNNVASRAITAQSVVLLYFDGTDWIEYGGGGAGGADPLPVGVSFFIPTGDGSSNDVATYRIADGTNRRNYNRTTGGADTQDMDWYAEVMLSSAISSSKDITIYTRASDYVNCVATMTVDDQGGAADATGAVVVTPTANDTWEAMTYTLTSTYTANEVIWIKIAITSLDSADTLDFASCSIDL